MGVTIHFWGKLHNPAVIDDLCEEMKDVSDAMEWNYNVFNDWTNTDETALKGIIVSPHHKAEPLVLMFDRSGTLRNAFMMKFVKEDPELTFLNHIKTQFAPPEVHIAVVKLLKYLQKKYFMNLEVMDEGDYWKTENAALLKEKIDFLNVKIDQLGKILDSLPVEKNDTPETIADKLEELLRKTFLNSSIQRNKRKK